MKKFIAPFAWTLIFLIIYYMIQGAVMLALTLTAGGVGTDLIDASLSVAANNGNFEALQNSIAEEMMAFLQKNAGIMLSISALISLMVFSLIYSARRQPFFSITRLNARPELPDAIFGVCAGLSSHAIIVLAIGLLATSDMFAAKMQEYESQMAFAVPDGNMLASLLGIGIIVPIVEEIMFRGMVSHELKPVFRALPAIAIQGALFGIYHMNLIQGLYAAPLGIFFGYIAYKSRSIWPAVAAHIAMNSLSLILSTPTVSGAMQQPLAVLLFMGVSAIMIAFSLAYFIKKPKPASP
jgi:membrane protease YdiL (CAAX protease family)